VLSSTPLPVFLLLCQTVIAVILVAAENKFGPVKTPRWALLSLCRRTADMNRFDWKVAKDQIPLCLVNVLGLM
jgi:GDP-fucose transporter C1